MEFNMPNNNKTNIIKVIGVGGGGSNAVNHMYELGIKDVDFIVCNTDKQALDISEVPLKIQLGESLTEGRGAGSRPEVGKNAAIETIDEIREYLSDKTNMVFITAGMGGGTGTGAAPIIAKVAKEMGILTVGIVTIPFGFEGKRRKEQADEGIKEMRSSVDTLLIINNDKLRDLYGNLTIRNAFSQADEVLASAAKGIAEVISKIGFINVDLNDVNTVMKDSGVAIMGTATAEGENRAVKAAEEALASPLLNDNDITGAKQVLLNITFGDEELTMDEMSEITDFIVDAAGGDSEMIMGQGYDETLGNKLCVTVIATGFNSNPDTGVTIVEPEKTYLDLGNGKSNEITKPISKPTGNYENPSPTFNEEIIEENTEVNEPFLKSEPIIEKIIETPISQENTPIEIDEDMERIVREEQQAIFNFETPKPIFETNEPVVAPEKVEEPVIRYNLEDEVIEEVTETENTIQNVSTEEANTTTELSKEEIEEIAQQRHNRINKLSVKLRTPFGLSELENEPAYIRRKINLEDTPHSSDSKISRFTLSGENNEDGTKGTLKSNNSFLHDNVD